MGSAKTTPRLRRQDTATSLSSPAVPAAPVTIRRPALATASTAVTDWCHAHPALSATALGVLAFSIAWLRLPAIARDTLWAEDGRDFLQGALDNGPLTQTFAPYAGYLQFLPRIIADITVQFLPVSLYALSMTFASCVAAGVMAAIVFLCARDCVPNLWPRVLLALLVVAAPLVPREVSGNTANLHSLVLWTMFWMLLYRPRTRAGSAALGILALCGALTEIQAVFLFPLFLWQWRDPRRLWPRIGCAIGVGAQLVVTLAWPRSSMDGQVSPASVAYGLLINAVVPTWVPQAGIGAAIGGGGILVALAACIPFAVALILCLRHGAPTQRVAAAALVGTAVLVYCVSVLTNPYPYYDYASMSPQELQALWLTRYGVVPSMMLCALFPLAFAAVHSAPGMHSASRRIRGTATVLVIVLAASLAVQLPPQNTRRSNGPEWQPQIASLTEVCRELPGASVVHVTETLDWQVGIRCDRLG